MRAQYRRLITLLCRSVLRHPYRWLAVMVLISLPAADRMRDIKVDTNLIRLLPRSSRASVLTRDLQKVVSDGGYFTLMIEGGERGVLLDALESAAREIEEIDGVESAEYTWPVDFIDEYRYLLIPNDYLDRIYEETIRWEGEVNPFVESLGDDEGGEESVGDREDREDLELSLNRYVNLQRYHESEDGRTMGLFVRTFKGVTSIGAIRDLYGRLKGVAASLEETYGVRTAVAGSHRNKIDEYGLIMKDLGRAGTVAAALIVLLLMVSFRSPAAVVVVLAPLFLGLLWAFALVPSTVGDFNLITAFLLVIMFGMGVDYSIHLVKRFQREGCDVNVERALLETYLSTGSSVLISGVTTALALSILAASDFRGFSEFGIIGSLSIITILLAMFLVLPAVMVLACRFRLLGPAPDRHLMIVMHRKSLTAVLCVLLAAAAASAVLFTGFDYNFRNLQFDKSSVPGLKEARAMQKKVYSGTLSPGALYLARDLEALDEMALLLGEAKKVKGSTLGRVRSLRDFSPGEEALEERFLLLDEIGDQLSGRWTTKIEDSEKRKLIEDFRSWEPPSGAPSPEEIPPAIRRAYQAKDGSGRFLLSVHPAVDRKDGRNAMAFTGELYGIVNPAGVVGPIGETVVFAEIIWIVTKEGPWLSFLTLLGVFLIVLAYKRSLKDTFWILLPLLSGVLLALGAFAALGMKLNFFNVVVIPALLGIGVDGGVHYYRRWQEMEEDDEAAQKELFDPLSIAIWTTMVGYAGMVFAEHPGIRSIGIFATLGLACIWLATLFLMPGLLQWMKGRRPVEAGETP
jgi:predicted RND superfamily exporter protein